MRNISLKKLIYINDFIKMLAKRRQVRFAEQTFQTS